MHDDYSAPRSAQRPLSFRAENRPCSVKVSPMAKWFELYAADSTDPPYVLILVGDESSTPPSFKIYDPKEADRLVEVFADYIEACHFLNEDDFYLFRGRQELPD